MFLLENILFIQFHLADCPHRKHLRLAYDKGRTVAAGHTAGVSSVEHC